MTGGRSSGRGSMDGRDLLTRAAAITRVDKPWGAELIWTVTDAYAGKILVIEAGKRLSLQRHERKDESIYVLSGHLRLFLGSDESAVAAHELGPGDAARIPVGWVHRYEAIDRVELAEVSTPELDDVVRLQDDFGRQGTNAP
jgi:mannose-6-phosphate isomerase